MKKSLLGLLTICSIFTMSIYTTPVKATDFSKDESKYIKLCSSSSLEKKDKKTCEDFNKYLKKKNQNLKEEIADTEKDLSKTNNDIDDVSSKVKTLSSQIENKLKEVDYLLSSITKIEKNISIKEAEMKKRLYSMQTYYNSNSFVEFIFGADSFSDFFSRLSSINDITSYENELVSELTNQKKQLDIQKETLLTSQASLESKMNSQMALQDQLFNLKSSQQNDIKDNQNEANKVSAAQKKIDDALDKLVSDIPNGGGGSYVPGSSTTGNAIAQKALTKQGARYWWGAPGGGFGDRQGLDNPNAKYFDCSGLVAWAHRQSGVKIGRSTASGYSRSGKSISYSQLQPGDVITFTDGYGSGVIHIGIYIGGGSFVHALGRGSGTLGQYPDQCVKRAKLSDWASKVYNYRRLY